MAKTRIGIIGTGLTIGISDHHVRAYSADERAEIAGIFDVDRKRALARAKNWSLDESVVCETVGELFDRVDAVSICTPNFTHEELIVAALNDGKHVLCEKPLAHTLDSARRAAAAAAAHPDRVAMVSFNYRDIPAVRYMKHLIDEGSFGRIFTCRMQLGGNRIADPENVKLEWRMQRSLSGAGAIVDFGCHMIDLANHLLGEPHGKITEVRAFAGTFIDSRAKEDGTGRGEVTNDDSAVFAGTLESGALISCLASRVGVPRFDIEIVGEGGMLIFSGKMDQVELWPKAKGDGYDAASRTTVTVGPEYRGREGHKGIIADFLSAIERPGTYERTLRDGVQVQEVLDRLEKSTG